MDFSNPLTILWALVIIGGPLALFLALNWAKFKTTKQDRAIDPTRPSDDPSQGMGPTR